MEVSCGMASEIILLVILLLMKPESLNRSIQSWQKRDKLSEKIGKGKYAIVAYDKIKRITMPLPNDHLLFVSLEGEEFGNVKNIVTIVDWVNSNMGL